MAGLWLIELAGRWLPVGHVPLSLYGKSWDQPAAEGTNEGQCLSFAAEPQVECGPIPGRLLQDDRL